MNQELLDKANELERNYTSRVAAMRAYANGQPVQWKCDSFGGWVDSLAPRWEEYYLFRPKPPEPAPWDCAEDVPIEAEFISLKDGATWARILGANADGISYVNYQDILFRKPWRTIHEMKWSERSRKQWHPCTKRTTP